MSVRGASTLRRLPAWVLDTFLVSAISLGLVMLLGLDAIWKVPDDYFAIDWYFHQWLERPRAMLAAPCLFIGLLWFWFSAWELACRRTPGALIFRLETLDEQGFSPDLSYRLRRVIGFALNVVTLGLGVAFVFIRRDRRGLHEWLSHTVTTASQKKNV